MEQFTKDDYGLFLWRTFPRGMHCPLCGCKRWGFGGKVLLRDSGSDCMVKEALYLFCANCGFVALRDAGLIDGALEWKLRQTNPERFAPRRVSGEETPDQSNHGLCKGRGIRAWFRRCRQALGGSPHSSEQQA